MPYEVANTGQSSPPTSPTYQNWNTPMPRRCNPDLSKDWKVVLPATLAGSVEFELHDPATGKPRYGERSRLICALLTEWLARRGRVLPLDDPPAPDLYTRQEKVI